MISIRNMKKLYGTGETQVKALAGVNLEVAEGEMIAIMGPSGSGKSTLMNMIGCLDRPTEGEYYLAGKEVSKVDDNQRAEVRNEHIGFIFQGFNLLSKLTALQNVETPLIYRGVGVAKRRQQALAALERVGLGGRGHHRPNQLSGGQQQRVAIARAIASQPSILLGDEPTGALDSKTGQEVLALFQDLNRDGRTVVLVTHDERVAAHCRRIIRLSDGVVISDEVNRLQLDAWAELAKLTGAAREVAE
ncbi:MAG TPA: ABC transporter ATP-binding protein [Symbiobacteriaceae bacterium]|nr:ABC transporter ATP-binding protein [Symbiobacteriaceae bacterium]